MTQSADFVFREVRTLPFIDFGNRMIDRRKRLFLLDRGYRSVYRDVADLIGQRVPIRGEAGIGYVLDRDFDMPPLMLTPDELEAAVLGAQWVADRLRRQQHTHLYTGSASFNLSPVGSD
jgi:hypothetical protein